MKEKRREEKRSVLLGLAGLLLVSALALVGCPEGDTTGGVSPTAAILPGTWHMNGLEGNPQAGTRTIPFTSVDFTINADFSFTFLGYIVAPTAYADVRGSIADQGNDRYQTSLTKLFVSGVVDPVLTGAAAAQYDGVVFAVTKGVDNDHITITVDQSDGSTPATNEALVMDGTYTRAP